MAPPGAKTLSDSFVSISGHVRSMTSPDVKFNPTNTFAETAFGMQFKKYQEDVLKEMKVLNLESKTMEAKLTVIEERATAAYNHAAREPYPSPQWDEKKWETAFKEVNDVFKSLPSMAADSKEQAKIEEFKARKTPELGELKDNFNQEVQRLDSRLSTRAQSILGVKEAKQFGNLIGQAYVKPHFKPAGPQVITEEDLKDEGQLPKISGYEREEYLRRQMEKLQKSKDKYFEGETEPNKGQIFEYTTEGCRPKPGTLGGTMPSTIRKNYAKAYGGALELLREKEPNCDAVFSIPAFKSGKNLKFIDEAYIRDKIIPVFLEAQKRGIPMKMDPALKQHIHNMTMDFKEERKDRWDITKKIRGEKRESGLVKQAHKLLDLETSMVKKSIRDRHIGKDLPEMEKKVAESLSELKPNEEVAESLQQTAGLDDAAKEIKIAEILQNKYLGVNYETCMNQGKEAKLNDEIDAIKEEMKTTTKATDTFQHQLAILKGQAEGEEKDRIISKNPVLGEKGHILALGRLLEGLQEKLKELDMRAKALCQAASKHADAVAAEGKNDAAATGPIPPPPAALIKDKADSLKTTMENARIAADFQCKMASAYVADREKKNTQEVTAHHGPKN